MLTYIHSLDELEKEAIEIDKYLNITCSDDVNEAVERGNQLSVYMARTGKMLADAKYWQDIKFDASTEEVAKGNISLSPAIMKKFIESKCLHENFLVNWITRLNATCTHQQEFMRTLISKAKAEMNAFRNIG